MKEEQQMHCWSPCYCRMGHVFCFSLLVCALTRKFDLLADSNEGLQLPQENSTSANKSQPYRYVQ
jgi:hypothetical protein